MLRCSQHFMQANGYQYDPAIKDKHGCKLCWKIGLLWNNYSAVDLRLFETSFFILVNMHLFGCVG